jgi:hypothetical protein
MAKEKRTVCFVETLFSTIAHHNQFSIVQAPELQTVIFRHDWTKETVHANGLFHPVKNTADHDIYRGHLQSKSN